MQEKKEKEKINFRILIDRYRAVNTATSDIRMMYSRSPFAPSAVSVQFNFYKSFL